MIHLLVLLEEVIVLIRVLIRVLIVLKMQRKLPMLLQDLIYVHYDLLSRLFLLLNLNLNLNLSLRPNYLLLATFPTLGRRLLPVLL